MKKCLFLLLTTLSNFTSAQSLQYHRLNFGLGFNFGLKESGEFELITEYVKRRNIDEFGKGFVFSLGIIMPYESKYWGESYNGVILEVDKNDLKEKGISNDVGVYLGAGYNIGRVSVLGKIGSYTDTYYENGFNSIMGLHHITRSNKEYLLLGASLNFKVNNWLALTGGYNTYTKTNLGLNFRFGFDIIK